MIYCYRLVIEYPAGIGWSNPPELWEQERDEGLVDPEGSFQWPQNRRYLSISGAKKRAELLRRYGCVVGIQRSEPIEWVEP